MDKYRILQVIGEGTYGKVFKAQEKETGRVVAIKKFKQREDEDPHVRKTMMREIRILREYRHTNIVNLRTVFRENGKLYLIFDYVQKTLLEELQATPDGLPFERIKSITYQILKANNFLHEGNIIHRDIKPENLLISKAGIVKLCDFGFARPLNSSATYQYTDYVSTRWYRAPELLVGDAAYSGTVDVWAIGCIFAEIFNGMPLFPGDSDLHTLQLILETVTADDMEHNKEIQELSKKQRVAFRMNPLFEGTKVPLASESIKSPETVQEVSLKALLKGINDTQLDFVRKCLVIDGAQRAKLNELLDHPVFDEDFKKNFDAKLQQMTEDDEKEMQEVALTVLTTKDGRPELSPEELVTEDEKNDDDDDDDDEFDDDDSSSAVGSPGETSSVDTPGSSSGVQQNRIGAGGAGANYPNYQHALYGGDHGSNSRDGNEMQSVKTAVPPGGIGEGLVLTGSDKAGSIDKLIQQNSMVSVSINNQIAAANDDANDSSLRNGLESAGDTQNQTRVLLSVSKTYENATPDSADYYTKNNLTVTQESLQTQMLVNSVGATEEQKNATGNTSITTAVQKEVNDSQEQLQITKGVNGTASLQNNKQEQNPRTEPQKKEPGEEGQKVDSDKKSNFTPKPKVPVVLEHHDIQVRVSATTAAPAADYFPADNVTAPMGTQSETSQLLAQHHTTPSKAQKRTSLNHYMIESSITEEIREENYSEKTSSGNASQQNTPNRRRGDASGKKTNKLMGANGGNKDRDDHVIVREGVTSMFQHSASMVVTEENTENSPESAEPTAITGQSQEKQQNSTVQQVSQKQPNQQQEQQINNKAVKQNKIIIENSATITAGTKDEYRGNNGSNSKLLKSSQNGKKTPEVMNSLAGTTTTKEGTEVGSANAMQHNIPTMVSRAQTLDQANANQVSAATKADSNNPIALKQQHTESYQKHTGPSSLTTSANQQQPRQVANNSGSSSNGNPLISKVNITFGATTQAVNGSHQNAIQGAKQQPPQTSLINLQMMNNSNASAISRQSLNTNGGNLGLLNSNSTHEQQSYQSTAGRSEIVYNHGQQRPGEMKGAMIDSRQQYANMNVNQKQQKTSGRAATNNSSQNGAAGGGSNKINNASNAPSQHSQSQQRSSVSLKQGGIIGTGAINNTNGMHQTAREFTPHKKPSLVAASPATIQQHSFGIEGAGIHQNGMDSTAAKTSQSRPGLQNNSLALGQQEMSVTHFSGKPIYQVQQYPKTVVKGPGPKQTTILKQTSSLEKLDNRNISPHKLPNLKPINNSSMSQYGAGQPQHSNTAVKPQANSDENRIGDGLTNLSIHQQTSINQRQGPNSMQNHFSSHQNQQRYPANSHSMNTGTSVNKLASGSTQSLTTKMNFTSQNYHRASNSQTNEAANLHQLTPNVVNAQLQSSSNQRGGQLQNTTTSGINNNSIAANSTKKSQLIHPLKLVAFPKLMATDETTQLHQHGHQNGLINVTASSPKTNGLSSKKTSTVSNQPTAAIIHHYHPNNSHSKGSPSQHNNVLNSGSKTTPGGNFQKRLPNNGGGSVGATQMVLGISNNGHTVSSSGNGVNSQNHPTNVHNALMMSSKTQASKMPKRYSDMGMLSTQQPGAVGGQQQQNTNANGGTNAANQSKFVAGSNLPQNNGTEQNAVALTGNTFHPTLTNEYMLSQDSLVLNEVNSRPSRQSSKNLEHQQPSMSISKNHPHQQQQNSVESHRPRNQAPSHMSSNNQKSRATGGAQQHHGGPNSHNPIIPANQSFHSTMKSKNNKFIHQNSSTSHHPTKGASVNQSGILASSSTKAPPATSDKKIHQHFLEEFSEATSQRASLARPKNATDGLGSTHQKTPMTSLFQKSKFFQSQSSNAENTNPNSLNVHSGSGYHQHQASNHYGQSSYHGQSTSPNRTIGTNKKQQEVTMLSNFTDKDSFPRRNITNKLRNASNLQHKKTNKYNQQQQQQQQDGAQQHASTATSPSPLSLHQREAAKNAGGIVLPNLGSTTAGNTNLSTQQHLGQLTSNSNGGNVFMNVASQHQQQHIMQVSLTQLHATANDPRSNNLSQSPNIVRNKDKANNLGTQKLSAVANVVQLNASEFNLRLTNNSQLSSSGGAVKGQVMPYQQIVRKPPSVIQPGRSQQYQMYLTPSQNYTSGANNSVANRAQQNGKNGITGSNHKQTVGNKQSTQQVLKNSGNGSSPTSLNKKISYENSFNVQKIKNQATGGGGNPHRSPVINGGTVSYKVKTETDWHRGSQQQLFEVSNMGQSNQLYRVSNQLLEKSISPQRIQQAMKRGSNVQMMSSQGGIAVIGGPPAAQSVSNNLQNNNNYTENKINFSNQQQKRRQTGATVESGQPAPSVAASSGIINDSSQDSLPVQSPNLLRKKFISKQQNQIK